MTRYITRYTVRTDIPKVLKDSGFTAYVHDSLHPDDPKEGCSFAWFQDWRDAERCAFALNAHDLSRAGQVMPTTAFRE